MCKERRHPGRHKLRAAAAVEPREVLAHRLLVDVAPHDLRLDGLPLSHACVRFVLQFVGERGSQVNDRRVALQLHAPVPRDRRVALQLHAPVPPKASRKGQGKGPGCSAVQTTPARVARPFIG